MKEERKEKKDKKTKEWQKRARATRPHDHFMDD
jgi:hypothetical protein